MEYENLQIEVPVEEEEKGLSETLINPLWEKKYHNKSKGFAVGLDLQSKEAVARRLNRAKRFGMKDLKDEEIIQKNPFKKIQLADVKWPPVSDAVFAQIRPESIHIHGVDKMSTKDVFHYLKDHAPDTMEWIDDYSCNVVWESEQGAMIALKAMSKTFEEITQLNSDNDENTHTVDEVDEEAREKWRIALPYKENNALFMRQATVEDKKLPGAAKRSLYYLTHGRGRKRKGLVSSSRKRKIKQAENFLTENVRSKGPDVTFLEVDDKNVEESEDEMEEMEIDDADEEPIAKRFQKSGENSMRMRMYADDVTPERKKHDVFERIGNEQLKIEVTASFEKKNRWTSGKKNQHRRDGSSSEDEEDEEEDTAEGRNDFVLKTHSSKVNNREKRYEASSEDIDLREGLDAKHNKSGTDQTKKDVKKNEVLDLRQKIRQNKKHLGLTKDQLNLCIEVTEVSDEDDV